MASLNKVMLIGNLTRDPQVRYTPSGTAVAELGLAVSRQWYDKQANEKKEETTFVDITLWGRQAEVAGEYLAKGRSVYIEGRLQLDQWEDRESGQKRSKLKVVGEMMQMLGGRDGGGSGGGGGGGGGYQGGGGGGGQRRGGGGGGGGGSAPKSAPQSGNPADSFYDDGPTEIPADDVPF
ncbi:single-stranded DNA-binding protein [Calycomorphotria hydatis]|uniref:Single-stranded DNA-binding protein n=1 Tax=Calycomorphotria hydatis TaxID=2528027 RepID=A0A517TCZ0_9PLAN|nr:single-stranded DNA-binding protein [Calycomorphotria hydatis]QDT66234.1 Single-stranded DNA-binding protein [Calycomorphotria hydatis]